MSIVRYNNLKIYVAAGEAKPGGNIGAMLSPYLFSANMSDFCKKFNEITKDYENGVWLPVVIYTDIAEKYYSFFIKNISISMFILDYFLENNKIDIIFLYDLIVYIVEIYKKTKYEIARLILSILKVFRKRYRKIKMGDAFIEKVVKKLKRDNNKVNSESLLIRMNEFYFYYDKYLKNIKQKENIVY